MARMWCSCPCTTPEPLAQVDAERGPEERRLDVVGRQRVPGEQHVDEAGVDQRAHRRGGAGVHDRRTPDPEDALAGRLTSRICWAIWRTCSAWGFSLDTTEFMNSNDSPSARASARGSP